MPCAQKSICPQIVLDRSRAALGCAALRKVRSELGQRRPATFRGRPGSSNIEDEAQRRDAGMGARRADAQIARRSSRYFWMLNRIIGP